MTSTLIYLLLKVRTKSLTAEMKICGHTYPNNQFNLQNVDQTVENTIIKIEGRNQIQSSNRHKKSFHWSKILHRSYSTLKKCVENNISKMTQSVTLLEFTKKIHPQFPVGPPCLNSSFKATYMTNKKIFALHGHGNVQYCAAVFVC